MAAVVVGRANCDGFRVESPHGLVGWVEETWVDAPTGRLGLVEAVRFGARLDRSDELLVRGASAATLGREAAKGAGSGPITVPALARRDGAWAKRP